MKPNIKETVREKRKKNKLHNKKTEKIKKNQMRERERGERKKKVRVRERRGMCGRLDLLKKRCTRLGKPDKAND